MNTHLYKKSLSIAILLFVSMALVVGIHGLRLLYSRTAIPISYFQQAHAANNEIIDHQKWQIILDNYVVSDDSQNTYFKYADVTDEHRELLLEYIDELQALDPTHYNKDEQFAYWINLYNAVTINLVIEDYPVDSIKEIGTRVNLGPWDDVLVVVGGQELSLNNIEHGILRPVFSENRVHYAVNCASLGCPNLSNIAYRSDNIESQLETAATQFINSDKGVQFKDGQLVLSNIYSWFTNDFGGSEQTVLVHLKQYANDDLRKQLDNYLGPISYDYDWRINDAK